MYPDTLFLSSALYPYIYYPLSLISLTPFTQSFFRYLVFAFIGFANALPLPLSGSTLSIWLAENGLSNDIIGLFSLASLPFALKIFWTPLIDRLSIPFFKKTPRKGWLLFALLGMGLTLFSISQCDPPSHHPAFLALSIALLSAFTGCLYIVGVAYEIESLEEGQYGLGSAYVLCGYRLGLLAAGAGALYLSSLTSWPTVFQGGALCMLLGGLAIALLPEPRNSAHILKERRMQATGFFRETLINPCKALFQKNRWPFILCLLLFFKNGDQLAKSVLGPFLLSLGFDKIELATAAKLWGMASTLLGALLMGLYLRKKDPLVWLGPIALIHALSLSTFFCLALLGKSLPFLYFTVALDHLTGGMAMACFIAVLWKVADRHCSALHYTLFWSLFSLKGDLNGCIGGILAFYLPWDLFFLNAFGFGLLSTMVIWWSAHTLTQMRFRGEFL